MSLKVAMRRASDAAVVARFGVEELGRRKAAQKERLEALKALRQRLK